MAPILINNFYLFPYPNMTIIYGKWHTIGLHRSRRESLIDAKNYTYAVFLDTAVEIRYKLTTCPSKRSWKSRCFISTQFWLFFLPTLAEEIYSCNNHSQYDEIISAAFKYQALNAMEWDFHFLEIFTISPFDMEKGVCQLWKRFRPGGTRRFCRLKKIFVEKLLKLSHLNYEHLMFG